MIVRLKTSQLTNIAKRFLYSAGFGMNLNNKRQRHFRQSCVCLGLVTQKVREECAHGPSYCRDRAQGRPWGLRVASEEWEAPSVPT